MANWRMIAVQCTLYNLRSLYGTGSLDPLYHLQKRLLFARNFLSVSSHTNASIHEDSSVNHQKRSGPGKAHIPNRNYLRNSWLPKKKVNRLLKVSSMRERSKLLHFPK